MVKTEEDSRQMIMRRCMLHGTNVRYFKSILGLIKDYAAKELALRNIGFLEPARVAFKPFVLCVCVN